MIVKLLALFRADDTDFVVLRTLFATRVGDGVDMQARGLGLSGQFTQSLVKFLLYFVGHVILLSEEYDAAGGY